MKETIINAIPESDLGGFFSPRDKSALCIMICDLGEDPNNVYAKTEAPNIMRVSFDDTDDDLGITDEQAKDIVWWTKSHCEKEGIDTVVVSCPGGRSRSAAVACALTAIVNEDEDGAIRRFLTHNAYMPNQTVLSKVLAAGGIDMNQQKWQDGLRENERRINVLEAIRGQEPRIDDLLDFEDSIPF